MRTFLPLKYLWPAVLFCVSSYAQEGQDSLQGKLNVLQLSEIVIENAAPGSTFQCLNKLDIALRPMRSSQDILRMVPGLVIAQHAGGGKSEQIFLRGFDIDHGTDIRLTADGMPVNMVSHAHGQGYADLHFLIPELIEQVDFNKGPYYAAQGDLNTAGYAAFKTKNRLDKSSLKLEGGSFDSYRLAGLFDVLKKNKNKRSAYIASEYMHTNGYFESPQNFYRFNLMGKYHEAITENTFLTAAVSTFTSEWKASGQIPSRAVDKGLISRFGAIDDTEGGRTGRNNINLIMIRSLNNGSLLRQQAFATHYTFELYSNFTFFLKDTVNGDQVRQKESRNLYGYQGSFSRQGSLGNKKIISEFGWQLRYDDVNDLELSHTRDRGLILERQALGQVNQLNAGLYLEETMHLSGKLIVNAGLRFDQFRFGYANDLEPLTGMRVRSPHIFSPKLSLFYHLNPNTQLYIKAGTGFHSNDSRVSTLYNNKALPRAFGADIGTFCKPFDRLLVQAAVWMLDLEQEFVYVGDAAVVELSDYSRRLGLDLSMRYQLLDWLYADADANYCIPRSISPSGENHIPLAPVFTSIGGLSIRSEKAWSGGLRYRYIGDRPANAGNTLTAPGHTVMDVTLNYTKAKYEIGLVMENLLNVDWNEAQFETESRLQHEPEPVSELHYTPGSPFYVKVSLTAFF